MTTLEDIQKLEAGSLLELWELDARSIGGDLARFHGYSQSGPIIWQGNEYSPWSIAAEGFERTGGQQPRPQLMVGNVAGSISALCHHFNDLVGATLTLRRTFAKYLDAANFDEGNPTADPDEELPPEIWKIDRKAAEDRDLVLFELVSPLEFDDAQLPARQILAGRCGWITRGGYRGPYCSYTGPPVADINDEPTSDPVLDRCSGTVRGCKLRFGETAPLPYGGFPAAGLMRT